MNIEVRVITNAKKRDIKLEGTILKVKLTSIPVDGKANDELVEYLARMFGVGKSKVRILRGERDKKKIVSIPVSMTTLRAILEEKARVTTG
jgi:uncharacterized protein (TIGR00251 family)